MLWVRFWPLEVDPREVQLNELNSVIELRSFRRSCQDLFQIVLLFRFQSWSDQTPSDSKINKKWTWLEPLINRTSSPVAMIFFGELIVSYSSKFSFLLFIQGSITGRLTQMLHCQAACWALTWFIDLIFYFMSCWSINAIKCEHNQPDYNQETDGWIGFSTLIQAGVQSQVNDHLNRPFVTSTLTNDRSIWPITRPV